MTISILNANNMMIEYIASCVTTELPPGVSIVQYIHFIYRHLVVILKLGIDWP